MGNPIELIKSRIYRLYMENTVKKYTYPIVMCILTSMSLPAIAYELSCKNEYSNQSEVVDVEEADTFEEACKVVKNDISYSDYSNCKDAEGNKKGKCR